MLLALILSVIYSCSTYARSSRTKSESSTGAPQWENGWTRGAVFYEVFVRSFSDSNGNGTGDLDGLISKLDYLNDGNPATKKDLGVNALWLMPVFASPSYHGYDTTDYKKINPDYGTNQDFQRLLQEAHKRGIRIIVDYVMNHTSSQHPWFVDSASSPRAAKRNWYVWRQNNPGWTPPWGGTNPTWHALNGSYYYGVFWEGMPDLNYRNNAVRQQMDQIAAYWLDQGVDGFRLDAARHLIENGPGQLQVDSTETHEFWKEFSARIRTVHPQSVLVGENWTETPIIATYYGSNSTVAGGDELPMNFDFPLASSIISAVQSGNASGIAAKLAEIESLYPADSNDAPFLTNHDMVRVATQLNRNQSELRNAAFILLTLPGAPFLYYGEEVGLENGPKQGDESKRTPMPWDSTPTGGFTSGSPWFPLAPGQDQANVAAQINDPKSLLSLYRNLIHVRNDSNALKQGDLQLLTGTTGMSPVLSFLRKSATETMLVSINLSNSVGTGVRYSIPAISMERVFADGATMDPSGTSGQWTISLPPHAAGIWRVH